MKKIISVKSREKDLTFYNNGFNMINMFCNRVLTILEQSKVFNVLIFLCLLAKCNVRLHL